MKAVGVILSVQPLWLVLPHSVHELGGSAGSDEYL